VDAYRAAKRQVSTRRSSRRRLSALDGAALVLATVFGAGIFTVPAIVAQLAGGEAAFIAVWIAGGALALAGALTYAELASRLPEAGGEYVYLREAFGPLTGFLSGWTSFVAGFSGAIAASATGFALYAQRLLPALGGEAWLVIDTGPVALTFSPATALALALICLISLMAISGIETGRIVTNVLAGILVLAVALVSIAGSMSPRAVVEVSGFPASPAGFAAALVPVMFTFSGWNAAAYVTNEFEDPSRNVPRALVGGTIAVTLLYLGLNALYLRTMGLAGIVRTLAPADAMADVAFGAAGAPFVTVIVLVALASSVCAMVVTGPRIYRQMARDGALPRFMARERRADANPVTAIAAQSIWSALLVVTGTFETLVTYTGVAIVLFGGAAVCAVFVLRHRGIGMHGFRVPGYPVVPAVFVAASVWMLVAIAQHQPRASLMGVVVILAGLPFFWLRETGSRAAVVDAATRLSPRD